ncbi:MAG: phosphate/phosphite/phosphonate ABC transporter substrate-binding protein [Bdellovibrio sp.]|nr:phosphate/phosphite/phosphonate ABC transporter substrate-binding protein [Bdellovibrio sp.]
MKIITLILFAFLFSCKNKNELGSKENPVKFYLVPAQDRQALLDNGEILKAYLEKELGLSFSVELPTNFVAVIEAFGSKRADVALINTFGYIIAHDKYQVEARLRVIDKGRDEYHGQIITRADSSIKSVKDIDGKKFAYVDPASASGYLLPLGLFKKEHIKPKETIFAGRHDSVVTAVYSKQADAGATFYSPDNQDARKLVKTQFPDVYEKIKILELTGPIPNDPVIFRKDLPENIKNKIIEALKKYVKMPEGAKVLHGMYHFTDLKNTTDKDYDTVRKYLTELGKTAEDFIK